MDVSGDLQPVQHLGLDPAAHLGDRLGGIHRSPPQSVYRSVEYRIPDVGCLEHQQMACLGGFPVRGGPNALRQSKIQYDRGSQGLRASILVQQGPSRRVVQQQKQEVLRNLWHEGTIAAELVT